LKATWETQKGVAIKLLQRRCSVVLFLKLRERDAVLERSLWLMGRKGLFMKYLDSWV
jgi:hypothetical protein